MFTFSKQIYQIYPHWLKASLTQASIPSDCCEGFARRLQRHHSKQLILHLCAVTSEVRQPPSDHGAVLQQRRKGPLRRLHGTNGGTGAGAVRRRETRLDVGGETLSLLRPGTGPQERILLQKSIRIKKIRTKSTKKKQQNQDTAAQVGMTPCNQCSIFSQCHKGPL